MNRSNSELKNNFNKKNLQNNEINNNKLIITMDKRKNRSNSKNKD